MKKAILILSLIIGLSFTDTGQSTFEYKDSTYTVCTGPKGGKFIVLKDGEKHYIKSTWEGAKDNGDGTATYKGQKYPITVGPKGGRYIIVNNKKIYLKK